MNRYKKKKAASSMSFPQAKRVGNPSGCKPTPAPLQGGDEERFRTSRNDSTEKYFSCFIDAAIIFLFLAMVLPIRPFSADASTIAISKHNLSVSGPGPVKATTETQICVFCHTPHSAIPGVPPLWNHTLSSASYTVPSKSMPAWTTMLSTPQNPPDGDSRLCLSCHDGTVAVGSIVNLGGMSTTIAMQGGSRLSPGGALAAASSAYVGTDLSGHHPVSIEVNNALLSGKDDQCINGEISWRVCNPQPPIVLRPTNNLFGGGPHTNRGVQCSSCHDAHNDRLAFLRVGTPSDLTPLCTTCHFSCWDGCP